MNTMPRGIWWKSKWFLRPHVEASEILLYCLYGLYISAVTEKSQEPLNPLVLLVDYCLMSQTGIFPFIFRSNLKLTFCAITALAQPTVKPKEVVTHNFVRPELFKPACGQCFLVS